MRIAPGWQERQEDATVELGCDTALVVAAVHYLASDADQSALLDYLGEPAMVTVHPWPVFDQAAFGLTRTEALTRSQVMVVHRDLGSPVVIRPGSAAMAEPGRSGLFNRLNWERLRPASSEGLVDSNSSPVLFWNLGKSTEERIGVSEIGSQADSIAGISKEYEAWVNRTIGWVRRKGTKVWGLDTTAIRPDLDIRLTTVSTVYALPGALGALQAGAYVE